MGSSFVVLIRCDANTVIASGHMMRCLTIAEEFRNLHTEVIFVVSDCESEAYLHTLSKLSGISHVYPVVNLKSSYRNPDSELTSFTDLIHKTHANLILIDSYFVTAPYLSQLSGICQTAYIDDLYSFDYPVHTVINYDLHPKQTHYSFAKQLLLGASYAPLRPQFKEASYVLRNKPHDIFISTGGTDPYEISYHLLNLIFKENSDNLGKLTFHVLTRSLDSCPDELSTFSRQHDNVILYENVTDMANLMCNCDIAITAGGTTLYELCAVSVPTICYAMADNQITPALDFEKKGCCIYSGDCRENPAFFKNLRNDLFSLCENKAKREFLSHNMSKLMDGKGASRIAAALVPDKTLYCI